MKNRIIILAGILTMACVSNSHALVTILRDASNLSRGTMPDERHNPSSVTLQGNAIRFTDLAYSTSILTGNVTSYAPAFATAQSTANALLNPSNTNYLRNNVSGVVFSSHIANATVAGVDVASNTINGYNIAVGTITDRELALNSVLGNKISSNTINGYNIATATITARELAVGSVGSSAIADNSIQTGDILNGNLLGEDLQENTITNLQLASNTVSHVDMADQTLTGTEISSTAVLYVTSVTATGSFSSSGSIRGGTFYGDGSNLTGIVGDGNIRSSAVIVGQLGATGVDIASNTIDGYVAALRLLGASGLITSTTGQGRIIYNPGTYTLSGATLPAGVTLIGTSSSVFKLNSAGATLMTVYGKIDGMGFDGAGLTLTANFMVFKTGSRMKNSILYGTQNASGSNRLTHIYMIGGTPTPEVNDVILEYNFFYDWRGVDGELLAGDDGAMAVYNSSGVFIRYNYFRSVSVAGNELNIWLSTNVRVYDNTFDNIGAARVINMPGGNADIKINNNGFYNFGKAMGNGAISLHNSGGATTTSTGGIIVEANIFSTRVNSTSNLIDSLGGAGANIYGVKISGNHCSCYGTNSFTVINLVSMVINGVIEGNTFIGCFDDIADAGTQTQYTGNDNFKAGAEQ